MNLLLTLNQSTHAIKSWKRGLTIIYMLNDSDQQNVRCTVKPIVKSTSVTGTPVEEIYLIFTVSIVFELLYNPPQAPVHKDQGNSFHL